MDGDMKIELAKILELIEKKNSWGKNELKEALLNLLAESES